MDPFEEMEQELHNDGITVSRDKLPKCIGYFSNYCDFIYLNVDRDLTGAKALSVLSHEMGHYRTGLIDYAGKNEYRADKWAINKLVNPACLISALQKGCRNFYEISKFLNLDEQFLIHGLLMLPEIYGEYYEHDNYVLSFNPLMVSDRTTKQIWPET